MLILINSLTRKEAYDINDFGVASEYMAEPGVDLYDILVRICSN